MWSHQWWVMSHESSHSALWVLPYRNMHIRMRANWILVFWICTMISEKNIWGFLFIQFYFLSNIWSFPLFFLSLNFFSKSFLDKIMTENIWEIFAPRRAGQREKKKSTFSKLWSIWLTYKISTLSVQPLQGSKYIFANIGHFWSNVLGG